MTTGEVIASVVATLGHEGDASKAMSHRVRANLAYLARSRGLVVKEGERAGARLRLAGLGQPPHHFLPALDGKG